MKGRGVALKYWVGDALHIAPYPGYIKNFAQLLFFRRVWRLNSAKRQNYQLSAHNYSYVDIITMSFDSQFAACLRQKYVISNYLNIISNYVHVIVTVCIS